MALQALPHSPALAVALYSAVQMLKSNQCQVFVCPSEIMAALAHDETCCICCCQKSNCCWLGFPPFHIWSAFLFFFFVLFLLQIFKCLGQTGVQQCRVFKHQGGARKQQTSAPNCGHSCGCSWCTCQTGEKPQNVYSQPLSDSDICKGLLGGWWVKGDYEAVASCAMKCCSRGKVLISP